MSSVIAQDEKTTIMVVDPALVTTVQVYKAVGSECSITAYFEKQKNRSNITDWGGFYFQFNEAHCLGTVPYRFDSGYSISHLLTAKVCLENSRLSLLLVDDRGWMCDNSTSGQQKAVKLKQLLQIPESAMLMDALAKRTSALVVRETSNEWELIVPPSLLFDSPLLIDNTIVAQFRPGRFGTLVYRKEPNQSTWSRFDEVNIAEMPNNPPEWIISMVERERAQRKGNE